ncbi:hypothetical protein HDU76_004269 [Blyttiomyces sp. JEL0837]|nr:hypothetical protein HDU76_004269 [Blyttiomyces sp. JEL0837]
MNSVSSQSASANENNSSIANNIKNTTSTPLALATSINNLPSDVLVNIFRLIKPCKLSHTTLSRVSHQFKDAWNRIPKSIVVKLEIKYPQNSTGNGCITNFEMGDIYESFEWYDGVEPLSPTTSLEKSYYNLAECQVELRANVFFDNPSNLVGHVQDFVLWSVLGYIGSQKVNVLCSSVKTREDKLLRKLTRFDSLFNFAASLRPKTLYTFHHPELQNHLTYPVNLHLTCTAQTRNLTMSKTGASKIKSLFLYSKNGNALSSLNGIENFSILSSLTIRKESLWNCDASLSNCMFPSELTEVKDPINIKTFLAMAKNNPLVTKLSLIQIHDPDIYEDLRNTPRHHLLRFVKLGFLYNRIEMSDLLLLADGISLLFPRLESLVLMFNHANYLDILSKFRVDHFLRVLRRFHLKTSGGIRNVHFGFDVGKLKCRKGSMEDVYFKPARELCESLKMTITFGEVY